MSNIVLTIAIVALMIAQLIVYNKQANIAQRQTEIMARQADISREQLSFQKSVSRAWVRAKVTLDGPIFFTELANDKFINLGLSFDVKNFGQVPAVNIRISTALDRMGGSDRESRLQKLQERMCKSARDAADSDPAGGGVAFPAEPATIKSGSGTGGLYRNSDPGALAVLD